jgi:hypothetical protein
MSEFLTRTLKVKFVYGFIFLKNNVIFLLIFVCDILNRTLKIIKISSYMAS